MEGGNVFRNASRARIIREIEDPLRRLRTDYSISIRFIGPIHL
jgi:aryl-alcohol dehydrogenase-like predicted oxidoreductase